MPIPPLSSSSTASMPDPPPPPRSVTSATDPWFAAMIQCPHQSTELKQGTTPAEKKSLACYGAWHPSGVLIPGVYLRSSPNANSADIEFSLQLDVKDATGVAYQAFDGTPCMLW
ncbi:hypothetical protein EJB05_07285, partial [Eragrostis curvula]